MQIAALVKRSGPVIFTGPDVQYSKNQVLTSGRFTHLSPYMPVILGGPLY